MSVIDRYNRYIESILPSATVYDFENKQRNVSQMVAYNLCRTQSMFKWDGLPDTIPARNLELYLQINGNACFYKHNGELYVFTGGMGGVPDVYYMPTIYTIANPALNLSVQAKIGIDCVVMPSDSMYMGLLPIFTKWCTAMAETELTMDIAVIMSRIQSLISASDDRTKASAEIFLQDLVKGKIGVIAENAFFDGIKTSPLSQKADTTLTNLIEIEQYFRATQYHEIGLNANYNMKREALGDKETGLNEDALLPLIDDMLKRRQEGAEKVNEMFGTEITVDFASSWKDNIEELEMKHQAIMAGMSMTEESGTEPEEAEDNPIEGMEELEPESEENEEPSDTEDDEKEESEEDEEEYGDDDEKEEGEDDDEERDKDTK